MQCKTHECSLSVTSHTNSHHFIFRILCPSVTCSHFLLPLTHDPVTSPLPPPLQLHASPLLPFAPPAQLCSLNSLKLTLLCELCAGWWSVSCSSTRLSPGTESTARWQIRYTHAHTHTDVRTSTHYTQTHTHTHTHTHRYSHRYTCIYTQTHSCTCALTGRAHTHTLLLDLPCRTCPC